MQKNPDDIGNNAHKRRKKYSFIKILFSVLVSTIGCVLLRRIKFIEG